MKKLTHQLIMASLPALIFSSLSMASESGSALKNDSLRFEPFADAKVTGNLSRGDSIEILKKQGAWLQIKTNKTTGWVRVLSVKRGSANTNTGNQSAGVLAIASGRAGTGQVVSTTGVRGLGEEELKAAKFNESEIKKLESYTLNAEQGRQFASNGKLEKVIFSNLKPVQGEAK